MWKCMDYKVEGVAYELETNTENRWEAVEENCQTLQQKRTMLWTAASGENQLKTLDSNCKGRFFHRKLMSH